MTIEERREQVEELAKQGLKNGEIADRLGVSTSTVSSDKRAIAKDGHVRVGAADDDNQDEAKKDANTSLIGSADNDGVDTEKPVKETTTKVDDGLLVPPTPPKPVAGPSADIVDGDGDNEDSESMKATSFLIGFGVGIMISVLVLSAFHILIG